MSWRWNAPTAASCMSVSATAPSRAAWSSRPSSRSPRTRPRSSVNVSSGMVHERPPAVENPWAAIRRTAASTSRSTSLDTARSFPSLDDRPRRLRGPVVANEDRGHPAEQLGQLDQHGRRQPSAVERQAQRRPSAANGSRTSTVVRIAGELQVDDHRRTALLGERTDRRPEVPASDAGRRSPTSVAARVARSAPAPRGRSAGRGRARFRSRDPTRPSRR